MPAKTVKAVPKPKVAPAPNPPGKGAGAPIVKRDTPAPVSRDAFQDMLRAPQSTPTVTAPSTPTTPSVSPGGSYPGGGGGGAITSPIAKLSFDDFIRKDFGYNQVQNENSRRMQDFEAETLRGRQQTEAEQQMRRAMLQQTLSQMGGDWANDAANRGILRSGLYMKGQDRVDRQGVQGNQDIDQILSQFVQQRQQEQVQQETMNRSALNDVLSQLSQRFNSGLGVA